MNFQLLDLLPGLYVAALATGAAWVLGRWYDPLPRRVLLAFGVVVTLLLGKALFLGGVLLPLDNLRSSAPFQDLEPSSPHGFHLQADLLIEQAPYLAQVRRSIARLEWPLLNPLVGAGEPLLVNSQAQHFHPLVLLSYPFPLGAAVGVVAALKLLTALFFTFLLLRRLGFAEAPALAASATYAMGGFLWLYLGWPLSHSAAFLPALLYAVELTVARGGRRDACLVALFTIAVLLGGHPETILYVAAAALAFVAVRLAALPRSRLRRVCLRVALSTALPAAAIAPVLAPTAAYLDLSTRHMQVQKRQEKRPPLTQALGQSLARGEARDKALTGLRKRTLPVVAPNAFGNNRYGHYWGATTIVQDGAAFVGSAAALAALLALWPGGAARRRRRRRRLATERLALAAAGIALIFVVQPPGFRELLTSLPVLGLSASFHRRLTLVLAFGTVFLAACTWERWRRGGLRRPAVLLTAGALMAVVTWAYLSFPFPVDPTVQSDIRIRTLAFQLLALAGSAALLCTVPGRRWSWTPWAMALLASAELYAIYGSMNPAMPKRLYFPTRPSIELLQRELGDQRMVATGSTFRANVPVIYGIADARSTSPLQPASYFRLTEPVRKTSHSIDFKLADHPLYDLLGVRYVMVPPEEPVPEELRLVFRGQAWIYERPRPLPRLFLPDTARAADERDWPRQAAQITDFSRIALVNAMIPLGSADWKAAEPDRSTLRMLDLQPTRITAQVELAERRLLASSVYQDGGWRLLVDGQPTPTVITNGALLGAWLPAGNHRLELLYRPPGFVTGCLLGALALAAALMLIFPLPPTRRAEGHAGNQPARDDSAAQPRRYR